MTTLPEPKLPPKTEAFFDQLTIPTHPDYDFERDSGTLDYTPPVVANNYVILYSNAAVEATKKVVAYGRQLSEAKLARKREMRNLDKLRKQLLAKYPVNTSSSKNMLLTEAWVRSAADSDGKLDILENYETLVAKYDDEVDRLEDAISDLRTTMALIKNNADNIQTHLSFVKKEQELMGRVR